ncbi:MAG: hypothetical protein JO210_03260 [Acidobacteriaceae bacterium]|nr:hypothetical protein [Acidobacteriaceae bacterium]
MSTIRFLSVVSLLVSGSFAIRAGDDLSPDQMALLHDTGGWEYIIISDSDNGFPTQHTCFDGHPHPQTCSGTLTLTPANRFVQKTYIHHQSVSRSGTYQLEGNQLAFFDEFGNRDGPYTIDIDASQKMMKMDTPQVKMKLELYKEYRKQLDAKQRKAK